jgi:hypothetical protein
MAVVAMVVMVTEDMEATVGAEAALAGIMAIQLLITIELQALTLV